MIRSLFAVFTLTLLTVCSAFAANHYTVDIEMGALPVDGNSVTINGAVRVFKTTVAAPATQVLIGADVVETMENLLAQIQAYPLNNVTPYTDGASATNVFILADTIDFVITASVSGAWGTATVYVQSILRSPLNLPLSLVLPLTHRTNQANHVVLGLRDYASTNFPATAGLMVYFVNTTEGQTISGAKLFTGATVLSNAATRIYGGFLTNVFAQMLDLMGETNNIRIPNSVLIGSDVDGKLGLWETVDGFTRGGAASYAIADHTIVNGLMGDQRWFSKSAANVLSGVSNHFTQLLRAENMQGVITNATIGATNVYTTNLYTFGTIGQTNPSPVINIRDSDAAADNKHIRINGSNGRLLIQIVNDADSVLTTILDAQRTGTTLDNLFLGGTVVSAASFNFTSQAFGEQVATPFLIIGSTNGIPPDGMAEGLMLTNATASPTVDPTNSVVVWPVGGKLYYRASQTGEGAGANNQFHNAAAISIGSGSDYNLTATYAQVTFGGSVTLSLPSAGTYRVAGIVAIDEDGSNANDSISVKLYNSSDAADVSGSEKTISSIPAAKRAFVTIENIITITTGKTIQLYGKNTTAARGSIDSEQTSLSYIRLY